MSVLWDARHKWVKILIKQPEVHVTTDIYHDTNGISAWKYVLLKVTGNTQTYFACNRSLRLIEPLHYFETHYWRFRQTYFFETINY